MNQGWIKIHRGFWDWEWADDPKMVSLFLYCISRANHTEKQWRGVDIKRGQFYTSYASLSTQTGLSVRNLRTCFDKLETTGEASRSKHSRGLMVTVINYDKYQLTDTDSVTTTSHKRHANDTQTTTTKNDKNEKNEKKEETPPPKGSYSKKSGYQIEPEVMARWEKSYPNIDIQLQLKKAHEWLIQHDWKQKGGKPYKSMSAFATNWLNRQDKEAPPKKQYGKL